MKSDNMQMLELCCFLLILIECFSNLSNPLNEVKINAESKYIPNYAQGKEDLIRGIINSENRIVLGGSMCSFLVEN